MIATFSPLFMGNGPDFDSAFSAAMMYLSISLVEKTVEISVLCAITIDFDTLKDKKVTIRDRDTMKQERVKIKDLVNLLKEKINV